jgi:hypothetical protein
MSNISDPAAPVKGTCTDAPPVAIAAIGVNGSNGQHEQAQQQAGAAPVGPAEPPPPEANRTPPPNGNGTPAGDREASHLEPCPVCGATEGCTFHPPHKVRCRNVNNGLGKIVRTPDESTLVEYDMRRFRHVPTADKAVELLKKHFFNRTDWVCHDARWGGESSPCPAAGNQHLDEMLQAHLGGKPTDYHWRTRDNKGSHRGTYRVGTYTPAVDGTTRWICLDFDGEGLHSRPLADPQATALSVIATCERLRLPAHLERSKSATGWHVWILFSSPISAQLARRLGYALAPRAAKLSDGSLADVESGTGIELFPKADAIRKDGFGNLVWLPWHWKTEPGGNVFYRSGPRGLAPWIPDEFETADEARVELALSALVADNDQPPQGQGDPEHSPAGTAGTKHDPLHFTIPAGVPDAELRPGDDFNLRGPDWKELLDGWECVGQTGTERSWRRPGKDEGQSATAGHCKKGDGAELFYVFTSNAPPFTQGEPYTKFAVYALLRHGGDFGAAARDLAAQGYGAPRAPSAPPADTTADDKAIEELRELAKTNAKGAIDAALAGPGVSALARLIDRSPAALESFYRCLSECGATTREIAAMKVTVKDERKRLAKERAAAARTASRPTGAAADCKSGPVVLFQNYYEVSTTNEEGEEVTVRIGHTIQYLAKRVRELTRDWPKRVGKLLFARCNNQALWLENPNELFAWISGHLIANLATKKNQPAPNLLTWVKGSDKVTEARLYSYLQQEVEDFDAIELSPHHPPMDRTYYMHTPLEGGDGVALRELCKRFCPATPTDAALIEALILSLVWGGPPGQRPAWLITAEDEDDEEKGRGVGKSKLAELVAMIVGGFISLSSNEDFGTLKTRLLSPDALPLRVAMLDNIKSLKFSWAEFEGLVTSEVISGKRMYYGEGRRPNTLTYILTLNGASLSKDMAQRCVIVKLKRPKPSPTWYEETAAYVREHRWAILGDAIARLKDDAASLERYSRWGAWESAVLARLPKPSEVQGVIAERQGEVDDDASEAEIVRQAFINELFERKHYPTYETIRIPVAIAAGVLAHATREFWPTNKATAHLKTLHIPELKYTKTGEYGRHWLWTGESAAVEIPAEPLKPKPQPEPQSDAKSEPDRESKGHGKDAKPGKALRSLFGDAGDCQ